MKHTPDFMLNGMEVGYFERKDFPSQDGEYAYECYRGPGHYEMAMALRRGENPECYYDQGRERVYFRVVEEIYVPPSGAALRIVGFRRALRD